MTRQQDSDDGLEPRTRIVGRVAKQLERDPPWISHPHTYETLCFLFYVPTFLVFLIGMTLALLFYFPKEVVLNTFRTCHNGASRETQGWVTYIMCRALDARRRRRREP